MSVRIEIQNSSVEERSGKVARGDRAGQDYHIRSQTAWLHNGDAYPQKMTLNLQRDQSAYAVGFYTIAPASIVVGEYGRLEFSRNLELIGEPAKLARAS